MATAKPDFSQHPAILAARNAPRVQRMPPELKDELEGQLAEIKAGRARLVPHEEVVAPLRQARNEDEWRMLAQAEIEKLSARNEP